MKTTVTFLQLISVSILIVFIALCIGSTGNDVIDAVLHTPFESSTTYNPWGVKTESTVYTKPEWQITVSQTGPYNDSGFNGPTELTRWTFLPDLSTIKVVEKVNYVNGKKHGEEIITTTKTPPGDISIETICYHMGENIDCDKDERTRENDTAYEILEIKYLQYWYELLSFNYEEAFINSYMDTLEQIIATYDVNITDFEDSYEDAQDELENTLYDSLTLDNRDLSIIRLLGFMSHCEFRQAVFDRYRKEINSIYLVISELYPDFPQFLQEEYNISESAFENYCTAFDNLLNSYGPLDTENYLFIDSLDIRIFRAFQHIDSLGTSELQDVNTAVAFLSIYEFYEDADILMKCQREAYFLNNDWIDLPTVTTFLKSQNSDTEAEIQGFVANDGGAEVTKRGILWAQHYNPTMEDNQENAGSGTGLFSVILTDLTPGETYYARSFATNSEGTDYGNCIEFVAQEVIVTPISLPIDFESGPITANFIDFDGGTATVIPNPQSVEPNTSATVAQIVRDGGQVWAGSKLIMDDYLDFSTETGISMKVFSPAAGIVVKFKLEGTAQTEVDVLTTVANEWETLTWDFTGQPSGTFNSLVFMFDFGNVGDGSASSTFLFDDIEQVDVSTGLFQVDLPITFEDTATVDYNLADFGGNASSIVPDPVNADNLVGKAIKTDIAETWAGTSMGGGGLANPIPFTNEDTRLIMRVYSPDANAVVMLKVENAADGGINIEKAVMTTVANAWETLEFNFAEGTGGGAFDPANVYDKVSVFFNFGISGADAGEKTYYWDDVVFGITSSKEELSAEESSVIISPNPASNFIDIICEKGTHEIENILISDIRGNTVLTKPGYEVVNGNWNMDVSALVDGVYLCNFKYLDGRQSIKKFVVAH